MVVGMTALGGEFKFFIPASLQCFSRSVRSGTCVCRVAGAGVEFPLLLRMRNLRPGGDKQRMWPGTRIWKTSTQRRSPLPHLVRLRSSLRSLFRSAMIFRVRVFMVTCPNWGLPYLRMLSLSRVTAQTRCGLRSCRRVHSFREFIRGPRYTECHRRS